MNQVPHPHSETPIQPPEFYSAACLSSKNFLFEINSDIFLCIISSKKCT